MHAHGLIVGKFYPPHQGHHLLVRAAASACKRVTVLVMASSAESIPLEHRVAWMREVHAGERNVTLAGGMDEARIDYRDARVWDEHERAFRQTLLGVTDEPVDAVFSSEAYGAELARRFAATHVAIDPARELAPVSGSAVRADPAAHWERLEPCVRGFLAKRVVLVGAESTGKTTLAAELAQALCARGGAHGLTRWVREHGRDHAVAKLAAARASSGTLLAMEDVRWETPDFARIARRQNELEDDEARIGGPVLVCDTDAFATAVWHERYVGTRASSVEALAREAALYLLTHPDDVPFVQDGTRDGEKIRHWMHGVFVERLAARRARVTVLRGSQKTRRAEALAAIDALLAEGWRLANPLG